MEPVFLNNPNRVADASDVGKTWISRSCAVVSLLVGIHKGVPHVLMNKRGRGAPNNVGRWVLPCGYLDYSETVAEAALRETWEETGVDVTALPDYSHSCFCSGQPVYVNSNVSGPTDAVQNVSLYFAMDFQAREGLPTTSTSHCEPDEVEEVKWIPITDLKEYDVAFNHMERIFMLSHAAKLIRMYGPL